ncbi:hypothetical protein KFL_003490075 [Klebsormidium nitens]|uniref:histidine kinase n=1 Tax=Klebsormidium nitens TaxID=105231 RepID=A0A1Y1I8S8_KLENI|nr:hypothetical protein KFL_003490075 [Klebsormidium nitens]|eukprot:GAQ87384.1 hypothetical protein KFL_003490075 [Klebsormidium nitens]
MPTSPEDRPRIRRTRSGPKEGTAPLSQGAVSPPGKMEDRVFREKSGNLFSMSDFITPAPDVEYQMVSSDYKYRGLTESLLNLDGDEDPSSGVSASEWRQFLSSEQERVMARLKQEQAVMDKVVRLQQQRLHHEKEEAQILLLQNVAERDLELEQIRERSESKVRMEEREQRDSMLQAFEMKLQEHVQRKREHVQRKRVEDAKFEQLQAAHTLALQQALKLQRNRDAFNKRLEQKEERHTREGQELVQWQERTISNAEMSVNMRLKSIPTEAKAILIKAHALEIEHMRVTHAKQGDQLRERQLVNQKQTAKSFEYEQKCVHDAMKLEAGHLAAVQKLQAEHELELMKLKHSLDSDMQQYTRTRRAAGFEMDAETVTRKQKRTAKKLRARFQKEIEVKRRAWNNQLEDDFVDFMSEFDPSVSTDPASTTTPSVSADGDMGRHPPEHGNGTEGYGEDSNSGSGTEEERKQRKELADKIEEEEGAKQTNSMMRIKMVVDSHKRVLSALRKEHADAMDALRRESIAGAKRLRDRMESELKGMRQSQAEDMARLLKLQEKSVEATQRAVTAELKTRAVTAELKTVKALERERGNLLEFLGFVCHELRNPLCAITGLTEMVLASQGSTNPVDCTGTILTQCVIMKRIVDDVLDLSKIEEGKVDLKVEPIDLPELLDSTVSAYR